MLFAKDFLLLMSCCVYSRLLKHLRVFYRSDLFLSTVYFQFLIFEQISVLQ